MSEYDAIRAELEQRLSQLVERAERIDEDLSETPDADWEEHASESENDEVLASVGNLALEEIGQIKLALRQIESGTYGICARCKVGIPKERLEALPFATTCTKCA